MIIYFARILLIFFLMFPLLFIIIGECGVCDIGSCYAALAWNVQHADCRCCHHRSSKPLVPVSPFLARHARRCYVEGVTDRKWGVQVGCVGV